jgi:hypothetical protein
MPAVLAVVVSRLRAAAWVMRISRPARRLISLGVAGQHASHAAADRAEAEHADFDGRIDSSYFILPPIARGGD